VEVKPMSEALELKIYEMWDRLSDLSPARAQDGVHFLLSSLCELIGADDACWSAAIRQPDAATADPLLGWRPRMAQPLRSGGPIERAFAHAMKRFRTHGEPDLTTVMLARGAGQFRVARLCDVAPSSWFQSDFYRGVYAAHGMGDAMHAATPITPDAEAYIVLARSREAARFSEVERATVRRALQGLRWFHRRALLSYGMVAASAPLTATERAVLDVLLTGKTEKEIAATLQRSFHTTREHIASIYRKFGVNHRAQLMALWLGDG
jgi:DNA-binding CsgD family transcriptional regulator